MTPIELTDVARAYRALDVIRHTPAIAAFLLREDPKSYQQVVAAATGLRRHVVPDDTGAAPPPKPVHRITRWSGLSRDEAPWCGASIRHAYRRTELAASVTCPACLQSGGDR